MKITITITIITVLVILTYLYGVFQNARKVYRMIKKRYEEITKMRLYIHNGQIFSFEDRGFSYIIDQGQICLGDGYYLLPIDTGLVEQYWYIKFRLFFLNNKDNIKPVMKSK